MRLINKAIAEIVVEYRNNACLSQEELADLAGIHRTYVSQIERGLKSPTLAILFKISEALKVAPNKFVYGNRKTHQRCIEQKITLRYSADSK